MSGGIDGTLGAGVPNTDQAAEISLSPTDFLAKIWYAFWAIVLSPIWILDQIVGYCTGERSWSLRPYEARLLDAATVQLDAENKAILDAQLRHWYFVQRLHKDRMNDLYHYFPSRVQKLNLPANYQFAQLRLKSGRRRVVCTVETEDGLFRAFRFSKPPAAVVSGDFDIEVMKYGGSTNDRWAKEIDFDEHGGQHDLP